MAASRAASSASREASSKDFTWALRTLACSNRAGRSSFEALPIVAEKAFCSALAASKALLIVEDDKDIVAVISEELKQWGYETCFIHDFNAVLEEFREHIPQLILMDITLPYFNGYYWTQKIREESSVPIIFISSHSDDMDMVMAMQCGADDYITKPINIHLVRVKIQALLRRTYDYALSTDNLIFGNLKLNLSAAKLESSDKSIDLTHTELLILETLFKAKGDIAKRDSIMDHCWQSDNFIDDNTLAVNMTRLRKKLSEIGFDDLIQTKKGIGYYLKEGK